MPMKPTASLWLARALMKGRPVNRSTGSRISPAPPPDRLEKKQAAKLAAKVTRTRVRLMSWSGSMGSMR